MKVAINGRFLLDSFGGVRRFATELTRQLTAADDGIGLLVPRRALDLVPPGVPATPVGRSAGPLWEQIELPLWLARHGRPLLLNFANIAPIAYRRQISVLHDIAPALRPGDFTWPFRVQWRVAARWGLLPRGRVVVTDSDAARAEIAEHFGIPVGRLERIHLGADVLGDARSDAAPDEALFVAFGRHGAAKNTRVVVDAAASLPPGSPVRIEFVGDLDPELEPYAGGRGATPGRFAFRGRVSDDDLAALLRRARGFVWPSKHEGFGLPPLEAQLVGTPVVASDIPVNREILGDSALYFDPDDSAALADLLDRVGRDDDLWERLSAQGRANAGRFTWRRTADEWRDLIARTAA